MALSPPTLQQMIDRFDALGFREFLGRSFDLTLWGIRSPERRAGRWDDLVGCMFTDDAGRDHLVSWEATTDPGLHYLLSPSRAPGARGGTAIMVANRQYRGLWEIRKHKGRYLALCQRAPCALVRDASGDEFLDVDQLVADGRVIEGQASIVGLNLHRAELHGVAETVGPWSAGCQVLRNPWEWVTLMELAGLQESAGRGGTFSYALMDEWRDG